MAVPCAQLWGAFMIALQTLYFPAGRHLCIYRAEKEGGTRFEGDLFPVSCG